MSDVDMTPFDRLWRHIYSQNRYGHFFHIVHDVKNLKIVKV